MVCSYAVDLFCFADVQTWKKKYFFCGGTAEFFFCRMEKNSVRNNFRCLPAMKNLRRFTV